jgi:hypothetical protein
MSLLITMGLGSLPSSSTPSGGTTVYMDLLLPIVSVTLGPLYATEVNAAFVQVDGHDHSPGKGKTVGVNGLNINGVLTFNGYSATNLNSVSLIILSPTILGSVGVLYASGEDLWFTDGAGVNIQITASHSVNTAGTGGWTGSYGTGGSTASYTLGSTTFALLSNTAGPLYGKLGVGNIILYQANLAGAVGLTILSPLSTSGAYNLTLLPTPSTDTLKRVVMAVGDGAGNISLQYGVGGGATFPPSSPPKLVSMSTTGDLIPNGYPDNVTIQWTGTSPAAQALKVIPGGIFGVGAIPPTALQNTLSQYVSSAPANLVVLGTQTAVVVGSVTITPSSTQAGGAGTAFRNIRLSVEPDYANATPAILTLGATSGVGVAATATFFWGISPAAAGVNLGGQLVSATWPAAGNGSVWFPVSTAGGPTTLSGVLAAGTAYTFTLYCTTSAVANAGVHLSNFRLVATEF